MGFFDKPEVIGPGSGSDADRARIAALEQRVTRLEALLAQSLAPATHDATQPAPSQSWLAEVQALRRSGKLLHAIKLYREHTGVGLKEAKDAVEFAAGLITPRGVAANRSGLRRRPRPCRRASAGRRR